MALLQETVAQVGTIMPPLQGQTPTFVEGEEYLIEPVSGTLLNRVPAPCVEYMFATRLPPNTYMSPFFSSAACGMAMWLCLVYISSDIEIASLMDAGPFADASATNRGLAPLPTNYIVQGINSTISG